jgi:hypothetical protein
MKLLVPVTIAFVRAALCDSRERGFLFLNAMKAEKLAKM